MSQHPYFSDRERGTKPRTQEDIPLRVWAALCELIFLGLEDGSFGYGFPDMCPDGRGPCGTDRGAFYRLLHAEIPDAPEKLDPAEAPDTFTILDILQFCSQVISKPVQQDYHSYFGHYHLDFDHELGVQEFVSSVNRLFARNGIAFELTTEGYTQRFGPVGLREELSSTVFHTGDDETDRLLEDARRRILSPYPQDRRDALEKLWDAFERIKTLEPGKDKKAQVGTLLDRAAPTPKLRELLEKESHELTSMGNNFRIRHAEINQEQLQSLDQVDYFFHRMFSFLRLVLRATGRGD